MNNPETKTICMKISKQSHHALKLQAMMEDMTQSALIEKMIREYKTTDTRSNYDDHGGPIERRLLQRLKEEGRLIDPPKKGEASK
jgi:hypothetical protein